MVASRKDIFAGIRELAASIPAAAVKGPPFAIFNFITSIKDGHDVEIGFPIRRPVGGKETRTRTVPGFSVLALRHAGTLDTVSRTYDKLFGAAYANGLISDEFCREIYVDWKNGSARTLELQFVIHDWHGLLAAAVESVVNKEASKKLMEVGPALTVESTLDERFLSTRSIIKNLDRVYGDAQRYDIVSRCAHRFPKDQINKLNDAYNKAARKTGNAMDAVDAVIEFMANDPGWAEKPLRKGNIIYSSKAPRDPKAFEKATTPEERRKAYCFCPIIRERLDKEMPLTFCYCGAGWYRQQWEGAIGRPVRITIVESVLKGDERCRFAIHLPEDL